MNVEKAYTVFLSEYPDILKITDVCDILGGVCSKTVYKLINDKKLVGAKVGKEYIVTKYHLFEYLGITNN